MTMPVLFLSHGAPPLADDATWTAQLHAWSQSLPAPTEVLIVSAHWEDAPIAVSATTPVPLVHDFFGFPQRFYEVSYDAPPAAGLAARLGALLGSVHVSARRGLDHGAYVPLVQMYPNADVPVLQLSMPSLDPLALLDIGRRLAPLRDEGVLIIGSGFTTHNLAAFKPARGADYPPPGWSTDFDAWAAEVMAAHDLDALVDFENAAPAGRVAHPRTEHFAPLFVSLGAAGDDAHAHSAVDGFWFGLSKRSWRLD